MIRRLYAWVISWSEKKQAERALAGLSFAESSFFPIPPDPLLIAMVTARPHKWVRLATIATAASIVGGIFGYFIGAALQETVGRWIIDTYGLQEQFLRVGELYNEYTVLAVVIAGFTPIPYKLFSITAGVFAVNLPLFVLASLIGRSGRFFLVGFLMHQFGKRYKDTIERYIDTLGFLFIILVVLGVMAVKYML
ncbi:cytochrome B [Candidatus Saccharibacteria bacterium]|nr:MAG: cytochrome B [Candidatus Saccharibacteria bacterium]